MAIFLCPLSCLEYPVLLQQKCFSFFADLIVVCNQNLNTNAWLITQLITSRYRFSTGTKYLTDIKTRHRKSIVGLSFAWLWNIGMCIIFVFRNHEVYFFVPKENLKNSPDNKILQIRENFGTSSNWSLLPHIICLQIQRIMLFFWESSDLNRNTTAPNVDQIFYLISLIFMSNMMCDP